MKLEFTKPLHTMTADELSLARELRLPLHCQTMRKMSSASPAVVLYSDIEELTRENLDKTVDYMIRKGWRRDGVVFIRTAGGRQ